jgi:hypothetical protein
MEIVPHRDDFGRLRRHQQLDVIDVQYGGSFDRIGEHIAGVHLNVIAFKRTKLCVASVTETNPTLCHFLLFLNSAEIINAVIRCVYEDAALIDAAKQQIW